MFNQKIPDTYIYRYRKKYNIFVQSKFPDTCWNFLDTLHKLVQIWKFSNTCCIFLDTRRKLWTIWKFLCHRLKISQLYVQSEFPDTWWIFPDTCWKCFAIWKFLCHLIDKWYYLHVKWKFSRPKPEGGVTHCQEIFRSFNICYLEKKMPLSLSDYTFHNPHEVL